MEICSSPAPIRTTIKKLRERMGETPLCELDHAVYVPLVRVCARVHTLDRFKFEIQITTSIFTRSATYKSRSGHIKILMTLSLPYHFDHNVYYKNSTDKFIVIIYHPFPSFATYLRLA
jgi:hypothetical protein